MLLIDNRCFIIAEIGVNHAGNVSLGKEMIDAAAEAGADAVKFQTFSADRLVSKSTPKVKYQEKTTRPCESHYDMVRSLEFSREDHIPIIEYCRDKGIEFISTPYDIDSAEFLIANGVNLLKTASADITDLPLHDCLARNNVTAIVSTGMANLGEIETALNLYRQHNNKKVVLLHCVSSYPCKYQSLNMRVMDTLAQAFSVPVGYSDHAVGEYSAIIAVALGATVIEKHFTLDKNLPGPDHKASCDPAEFATLVKAIRTAELALGSPIKQVQEEEQQMRLASRKSIVATRPLKTGAILKEEDLALKRPGTGLNASYFSLVVGSRALRDIEFDEVINFGDFYR